MMIYTFFKKSLTRPPLPAYAPTSRPSKAHRVLVGGALGALDIISLIILRLPLARGSFFFGFVGHGEASVRGAEALCEAGDEGDVLFLAPDVSVFTSTHADVFSRTDPHPTLATRRRTTCALRRIVKTGAARRRSPSYTARV